MMKTLCVAVVVLSLLSVCQPAPLTCEQLLKKVEKAPDLTGRWYIVALSTNLCIATTLLTSVFETSVSVTFAEEAPNVYNSTFYAKSFGYCENESELFTFETAGGVNSNNVANGKPDVLLQTSSPDCFVVEERDGDLSNTFLLICKRQSVTEAELKEFEAQAKCAGWSKPQVLHTDHDYENCKSVSDVDDPKLLYVMIQRLVKMHPAYFACVEETSLYKSVVEQLNNLYTLFDFYFG